jgi:curved DNA-binding protein CbpA
MRRANAEAALKRPFQNTRWNTTSAARTCDHPDCSAEGTYRAPRARDRLDEYFWFCLDHVREYNRAWNFFEGMTEEQIEAVRRWDTTWNRPSWPFASVGAGPNTFRDDFGFFHEEQREERQQRRQWENHRQWRENGGGARGRGRKADLSGETEEEAALAELDLTPPVSFDAIKARYKELVKTLHPDVNGGDASNEDRLKTVNQAYATLRAAYARY